MKKTKNKFETSITLDKSTRDTLKEIKEKNGFRTYNEVLLNLLDAKQGYINKMQIIRRNQIAFNLKTILLNQDGVQGDTRISPVTFKDLANKPVGTVFGVKKVTIDIDYTNETCTLLFREGSLVIVRINGETKQGVSVEHYSHLFAVDLL